MPSRITVLAAIAAVPLVFLGARANATTFQGTATFADSTNTNNLTVTGSPNPSNQFTYTATAGDIGSYFTLMTLSTTDTATSANNTLSDDVSLTFSFSLPDTGSGSLAGTATETVTLSGKSRNADGSGSVTWSSPNDVLVTFSDGAQLQIDVSDVTLGSSGQNTALSGDLMVRFEDIKDPTNAPEPASMALVATSLIGLGLVRRRRKG